MADEQKKDDLKHELANIQARAQAAQHLLKRAADEIDQLVEADCDEEQKARASEAAQRFRRAATS